MSSLRILSVLTLVGLVTPACLMGGGKAVSTPPCAARPDAPRLTYAYPSNPGSVGECTVSRPKREVEVHREPDGRYCVDLQTVVYMGFQPKPVEMDNRYALRTDGGQSATFPMETVDVEKVGMCFGSGGDVGIWVSQLRGCVEPPADIETSTTLALQWMPAMMADRELARWDFTGRTIEEDRMRPDPTCEAPGELATQLKRADP